MGAEDAELVFEVAASIREFACRAGGEIVASAWKETGRPLPTPCLFQVGGRSKILSSSLGRSAHRPLLAPGVPAPGEERLVEIFRVPCGFASFEGLVFSLESEPPVLAASKCCPELLDMLEDVRPGDVSLRGGRLERKHLHINSRGLVLAHVLRGLSPDPRSGNPFYDEVRVFGSLVSASPRVGSGLIHVTRLAPVIRSFSCNFFHFLSGTLPLALALLDRVPADTTFLVYPGSFALPLLELLGIPSSRLMTFDPTCVYYADELFVVSGLNELGDFPAPETIEALRLSLPQMPRRNQVMLLIERRGSERRLSNVHEVQQAMLAFAPSGFEVIRLAPESLPVARQLQLVAECRLLVGTEGAGLGLSMFLPGNATVLNILPTKSRFGPLPSQQGYGYFHHLCSQRGCEGISYRAIACPDFDWDSPAIDCPLQALYQVLEEWAEDVVTSG